MEWLNVLGVLVVLLAGVACLVRQGWGPRHGERPDGRLQQAEIEQLVRMRSRSQGKLIVQEVDVKSLAYMKYSPSFVNRLRLRGEIEATWEHKSVIPFHVDMDKVRMDFSRDSRGALLDLTIVLPPPKYDPSYLKINLNTFQCLEPDCRKVADRKPEFVAIEECVKKLVRADLKRDVEDESLKRNARDAAQFMLQQFYSGLVPNLPLTIRFAEEGAHADGLPC